MKPATNDDGFDAIAAEIGAGRYAEAETLAHELLRRAPDHGMGWKALGVALRVQRKEALPALQRACELLPRDPEAHSNFANALFDAGRYEAAMASYRRVLDLAPEFAAAHNNMGNTLRILGRIDEAVDSYRRALALDPRFVEAHNNLGNTLRGRGEFAEAIGCFRQALALKPVYPEASVNLGNVHLDLGHLDEAAACYREALAADPAFARAHSNLGNVLRRQGLLDEAAASYRRALAADPKLAMAHSNLSDVLRDLGQLDAALASSRRAVALDPDFAQAHNSLGNVLLDRGQLIEAESSYRRAIALLPQFAEAHGNLGIVLRVQQRTAEAAASCRRALEIDPGSAPNLTLLAELRADDGQFAEAESLFRRAIEIARDSPEAWAGIAHLRKMTEADSAWLVEAERIAAQGLPARREVYLRYAIGKYCDDLGDYDRAFANFRRANDLSRLGAASYDRGRFTADIDRIIAADGRAHRPRQPARGDSGTPRAVFIVGMPRSGTTLTEQILASHPSIVGAGELPFWGSAAPIVAAAAGDGRPLDGAAADLIASLGREYRSLIAGLSGTALCVVDKMPANFLHLSLILDALPEARIVHMRRDPLDTCLSVYFQHFKSAHTYANDLGDLAHYYQEYSRLMRHWRETLPRDVLLDVPYESLVEEPEKWSRRMIEFVGLPWSADCLEFHRTRRTVITASKWQVRQKISKSSVARWRHYERFLGPLQALRESSAGA